MRWCDNRLENHAHLITSPHKSLFSVAFFELLHLFLMVDGMFLFVYLFFFLLEPEDPLASCVLVSPQIQPVPRKERPRRQCKDQALAQLSASYSGVEYVSDPMLPNNRTQKSTSDPVQENVPDSSSYPENEWLDIFSLCSQNSKCNVHKYMYMYMCIVHVLYLIFM